MTQSPSRNSEGTITVCGYSFPARIMGVPDYPSRSFQNEGGARTVPWDDWVDMQRRLTEAVEVIANLQAQAGLSEKPQSRNDCESCERLERENEQLRDAVTIWQKLADERKERIEAQAERLSALSETAQTKEKHGLHDGLRDEPAPSGVAASSQEKVTETLDWNEDKMPYQHWCDECNAVFIGGKERRTCKACVTRRNDKTSELERLREFYRNIEEAEARCCPEDVGFEEWIGILTKRLNAAQSAIAQTVVMAKVENELRLDEIVAWRQRNIEMLGDARYQNHQDQRILKLTIGICNMAVCYLSAQPQEWVETGKSMTTAGEVSVGYFRRSEGTKA